MKTASYTLIPFTAFGISNTIDGNYDGTSPDFNGDPVKAAAYYTKGTGLQTIATFLNQFEGVLTIEGTLEPEADTENYFAIAPEIDSSVLGPITQNEAFNVDGNFTWIRASVTNFTAGVITKVSMGY